MTSYERCIGKGAPGTAISRARRHLLATTTLIGLCAAAPVLAQEEPARAAASSQVAQADRPAAVRQRFDIPPQPLSSALALFGRQAGLQVAVDAGLVSGIRTQGVQGSYTPEQALQRLLAGTGLYPGFTDANTVTLARTGAADDDQQLELGPITVEGQASAETAYGPVGGYRARRSGTATRTDAPIEETPVSIQVVPQEVIEDQAVTELRDVYRNVSGVQIDFTGGNVAATEVAIIRGFPTFNLYRNGFPLAGSAPVELANIERVEVLKGPASILYGRSEPGGLVNLVTKRPLEVSYHAIEQEIGQYDDYRTHLDTTGPLTDDRTLLYRLNVAYTNAQTFRDYADVERIFVAPSLTWRPSDQLEVVFDLSYSHEDYPFDHGVAFSPQGEPVIPISRFLGEPSRRSQRDEIFAGYTLTYDVNVDWQIRNAFSFQRNENQLDAFRHFGSTNPDFTVGRLYDGSKPTSTVFKLVTDTLLKRQIGPTAHEILLGVDLRWEPKDLNTQNGPRQFGDDLRLNILDPQYGAAVAPNARIESNSEQKWGGIYLQDQISLLQDRLHVLVGGRYDRVEEEVFFNGFAASKRESALTGRLGLLYELTDWVSPYVNVSQSFNPTSPYTASVGSLDPERGMQYEGGLKFSLFEEQLAATLAAYEITKENVPIEDPANPGFSLNGGELRSRGVEIDIVGQPAAGVNIIATYAYTEGTIALTQAATRSCDG